MSKAFFHWTLLQGPQENTGQVADSVSHTRIKLTTTQAIDGVAEQGTDIFRAPENGPVCPALRLPQYAFGLGRLLVWLFGHPLSVQGRERRRGSSQIARQRCNVTGLLSSYAFPGHSSSCTLPSLGRRGIPLESSTSDAFRLSIENHRALSKCCTWLLRSRHVSIRVQ